jgi:hypothetical protein
LKTKQKIPRWILGVLNLIFGLIMSGAFLVGYSVATGYQSILLPFLAFALPFMLIAILNLFGGILVLKGKNQIYGIIGLVLFPLGVLYLMIMAAA